MNEILPVKCINRFRVGCDPEFAIGSIVESNSRSTLEPNEFLPVPIISKFFLHTGYAFGADTNGRLGELRPAPYRSTLHVVASLLATIKFMAKACPGLYPYTWKAGALGGRDGLGGHIHVARQSPLREAEIKALDNLTHCLLSIGVLPKNEQTVRSQHTGYGKYGDHRIQAYGYEYRTMPSWLESPRQAFICLTLAKLAVYNPKYFQEYCSTLQTGTKIKWLLKLVETYANRDEDCELLLRTEFSKSEPYADIKVGWGIAPPSTKAVGTDLRNTILPIFVVPTEQDIWEVRDAILTGKIGITSPSLVKATQIPQGWESLVKQGSVLVEMLWDKVTPSILEFKIATIRDDSNLIRLSRTLAQALGAAKINWFRGTLKQSFPYSRVIISREYNNDSPPLWISISANFRHVSTYRRTRVILEELGLPMVSVEEANDTVLQHLINRFKLRNLKSKLLGEFMLA